MQNPLGVRFRELSESTLLKKTERRFWEYFWKLVKLHLYLPMWATALSVALWYFVLYRNKFFFDDEVRETVNTAWIPTLGILYALIGTLLFGITLNKYMDIRCAINAGEFHDFMKWRNQTLSPVFHGVMTVLALGVLSGFAGLPYKHWYTGAGFMGGATYVFVLFYWVLREVDNPFRGIWVIRYIHREWLEVDPKTYREKLMAEKRESWKGYLKDPAE